MTEEQRELTVQDQVLALAGTLAMLALLAWFASLGTETLQRVFVYLLATLLGLLMVQALPIYSQETHTIAAAAGMFAFNVLVMAIMAHLMIAPPEWLESIRTNLFSHPECGPQPNWCL